MRLFRCSACIGIAVVYGIAQDTHFAFVNKLSGMRLRVSAHYDCKLRNVILYERTEIDAAYEKYLTICTQIDLTSNKLL